MKREYEEEQNKKKQKELAVRMKKQFQVLQNFEDFIHL